MRIPARKVSGDVGFNMTPMIDVVFQLIIFFLLSSHLAKQETRLPMALPTAASAQRQQTDERPRLTINVLANGEIIVASRPVGLAELPSLLAERRAAHGDQLEVRIRSDRSVVYGRFEPVLLACAKSGIWNVAFAVEGK